MSALIIPELIEQIASHLSLHDMTQSMRVNKVWMTLFLWRTFPPVLYQPNEWQFCDRWNDLRCRKFFSRLVPADFCSTHQLPPPSLIETDEFNDSGCPLSSLPLSTCCHWIKDLDIHQYAYLGEHDHGPGTPTSVDLMLHLLQKCTQFGPCECRPCICITQDLKDSRSGELSYTKASQRHLSNSSLYFHHQ